MDDPPSSWCINDSSSSQTLRPGAWKSPPVSSRGMEEPARCHLLRLHSSGRAGMDDDFRITIKRTTIQPPSQAFAKGLGIALPIFSNAERFQELLERSSNRIVTM